MTIIYAVNGVKNSKIKKLKKTKIKNIFTITGRKSSAFSA